MVTIRKKLDDTFETGQTLNDEAQGLKRELSVQIKRQENLQAKTQAAHIPAQPAKPAPCPIKLAKAEAISFSGEPRDFPRFKLDFNDIVVPDRDDQEIGLRLKQALPKKHSHLLDNFSLREHIQMMTRLEEYFGTSEKIICSITADIKKLKMPSDGKSFISFVERIEAAERELRAVNLIGELANESSLTKISEKFPNMIAQGWSRVIEDEELLGKNSSVKFESMMKFLKLKKKSAEYEVSKAELSSSANKSGSRYCVVTGLTLSASASEPVNTKHNKKLVDCFVCSKKGRKADHSMSKCNVWVNLPFKEKRKLVPCVKHPFTNNHTNEDCSASVSKCGHCGEVDKHHHLMCDKLEIKTSATKAAKSASSDVLLKTMVVKIGRSGKKAGLMEDNGSTDNYVSKEAVAKYKLKKEADVLLQIEGINSTKTIDSAVYRVPLIDTKGKIHNIECYALDEITEETVPIHPDKYEKMCNQLNVRPGQVKRPVKVDILLSSRSNYLMSERVLAEAGGLKLYQGPLGLTISGSSKSSSRSYPAKVTPVISTVKKAKVMKTLTDKEILKHFKEESIGAECSPRCGNCECGKCALGGKQMSLKEERDYKMFKDNMFLDEKGTETDPGPYWRTRYPWKIPKEELIDNKQAVLGVMRTTERDSAITLNVMTQ